MKFSTLFTRLLLVVGLMPAAILHAQTISTVAGNGTKGYSGDGGAATSAQIHDPNGVAIDAGGNYYIADLANNRIRKVDTKGVISTVAGNGTPGYSGDGGAATSAQLYYPSRVTVDASGNLYIADMFNNRIRKVTAAGIISTVVGTGTAGYNGDGGAATSAQLYYPEGMAVDASGNLYIADSNNNRIRKVTVAGIISTVAGNGTRGYSCDGGAATSAQLNYPWGVAVDASGNLYIADTDNSCIRKVTAAGIISTVAGTGGAGGAGGVGYSGDGGAATSAKLYYPDGVAVDASGNLYIADTDNQRIRKVAVATGIISTIAGTTIGYSGDGGAATSAQISNPRDVAVDVSGNLYIADTFNNRIRKVIAPATDMTLTSLPVDSSFYGQTVTLKAAVLGNSTEATGTVTFYDGSTVICNAPVTLSAEQAGCSLNTLQAGTHQIKAEYTPAQGSIYPANSASISFKVIAPATDMTLSSSPVGSSLLGQTVTLTAAVMGNSEEATGTVTFYDGSTVICNAPVTLSGELAACSLKTLRVGVHEIKARYTSDAESTYPDNIVSISFEVKRRLPVSTGVNAAH